MSLVTIGAEGLTATIDTMGAQLMSLRLDGAEYLWQGDPRWWPRRAPILFPIVGCLRGGSATSAQGEARLGRHGLARSHEHEVVGLHEDGVTFELCSSDQTRQGFPYDFRLNMGYSLGERGLTQSYAVTNTGEVDLPFTLGGHPAFNVPVPESTAGFDEYRIRFSRTWTARVPGIDQNGIHDFTNLTEVVHDSDVLDITHGLFERMLTVTLVDVPDRRLRLEAPDVDHGVELAFEGFDYLGLWTASADAPFLAIEPWRGCATATDESDVFEEKRGMTMLPPGESVTHSFDIRPF